MTMTETNEQTTAPNPLDVLEGCDVIDSSFATVVTPELAKKLLEFNHENRIVKEKRVADLAGALERGEWQYNGDAVRVSNSRLLDGQHRLLAIIRSGIPATLLLVHAEDSAQWTMDQGAKRTFSDFLQMEGERYPVELAAAVRLIYWWEFDGMPSGNSRSHAPSIAELFATLGRNPDLRDSIRATHAVTLVPHSQAAAHHHIFTLLGGGEAAEQFWTLVRTGEALESGNPILVLRERLARAKSSKLTQLPPAIRSRFIITAWNAWVTGQTIQRLNYVPTAPFPDVLGLDDGGAA